MELTLERQQLQAEVTNLRQSLEEIREKHEIEVGKLRSEVEETQSGKEHVETQYRNLLGKLNTIRSQLGDRLKADAVREHRIEAEPVRSYAYSCRKNFPKRRYI